MMNKTVYFAAVLVAFIPLIAGAQDVPLRSWRTAVSATG
jgi:hypothetical protein